MSCQALTLLEPEYWQEESISSENGVLVFNSETILDDLEQGDQNIFIPYKGAPEATSATNLKLVKWSQADYLLIAEKLHEYVWNESWRTWKVNHLFFRMDCDQADNGPQIFSIKIYKISHIRDEKSRIVRVIDIKPLENLATWREFEKYPQREEWSEIEMEQLKITADVAFQLAEERGGKLARSSAENNCTIFIQLIPSINDLRWDVGYVGEDPQAIFDIVIDPFSDKSK